MVYIRGQSVRKIILLDKYIFRNSVDTWWKYFRLLWRHFWAWLYLTNAAKMSWRYCEAGFGVIFSTRKSLIDWPTPSVRCNSITASVHRLDHRASLLPIQCHLTYRSTYNACIIDLLLWPITFRWLCQVAIRCSAPLWLPLCWLLHNHPCFL